MDVLFSADMPYRTVVLSPQVNFNEPLSMLQRMGEEMKYADILHRAANAQDTLEEMAYVGAFANSPYAATAGLRANKPFNPMLGETYECDRRAEMGWRCIFEQVTRQIILVYCCVYIILSVCIINDSLQTNCPTITSVLLLQGTLFASLEITF